MKNKKSSAFTLMELLITIVLLGVVGTIVIYNMSNVSTSSKENEYEKFIASVKSAAASYTDLNEEAINDLYVDKSYVYITLGDMIKNGFLDSELENPISKKKVDSNEKVKVSLDMVSGALLYTYPVEEEKPEATMVAMSDYVVWGEPYNPFQHSAAYELAIYDESGKQYELTEENIKKFKVSVTMPSVFNEKYKEGEKEYNEEYKDYLYSTTSGTYEIEYSWLTEGGIRKTAKRQLRVMPKVSVDLQTNYNTKYNKTNDMYFYSPYNGSWKALTITPVITDADPEYTSYSITKQGIRFPNKVKYPVDSNRSLKNKKAYTVDSGDKKYELTVKVQGHYFKNYSYTTKKAKRFKVDIPIPYSGYVNIPDYNKWTVSKTVNMVKNPYVYNNNLAYYEYIITNSTPSENSQRTGMFYPGHSITRDIYDLKSVQCSNNIKKQELNNIYIRAVNNEGFKGSWSARYNISLTNDFNKIVSQDSVGCYDSNNCCRPIGNGSCMYTNKKMYFQFGDSSLGKFVVLKKYNDGSILGAYHSTYGSIRPIVKTNGSFTLNTCDGWFLGNYEFYSPALETIFVYANSSKSLIASVSRTNYNNPLAELNNLLSETASSDSVYLGRGYGQYIMNYKEHLQQRLWDTGVVGYSGASTSAYVDYYDMNTGGYSKFENENVGMVGNSYTSFVGIPSLSMVDTYGGALSANDGAFWTTTTSNGNQYAQRFYVYWRVYPESYYFEHGDSRVYTSSYLYIASGYGRGVANYNTSAAIKPLILTKPNQNICGGNGTYGNPYRIV